jgi:hypothetical protein
VAIVLLRGATLLGQRPGADREGAQPLIAMREASGSDDRTPVSVSPALAGAFKEM